MFVSGTKRHSEGSVFARLGARRKDCNRPPAPKAGNARQTPDSLPDTVRRTFLSSDAFLDNKSGEYDGKKEEDRIAVVGEARG